VAVMSSHCH